MASSPNLGQEGSHFRSESVNHPSLKSGMTSDSLPMTKCRNCETGLLGLREVGSRILKVFPKHQIAPRMRTASTQKAGRRKDLALIYKLKPKTWVREVA